MRIRSTLTFVPLALSAASLAFAAPARTAAKAAPDQPFWAERPTAVRFSKIQQERLERTQAAIDRMLAVGGPRTFANTLRPYDDALLELNAAGGQSNLVENTNPDSALRDTAQALARRVSDLSTRLSLDRRIYDALAALDLSKADAETRYYVEKSLRDFRLSGVDKDDETRKQVAELRRQLVEVGQEFGKNIRTDVKTVVVKDVRELDGLPQDYIDKHKPAADGTITLTTTYPDAYPVFDYVKSDDLRKRMYIAFANRAYPQNMAVLDSMIAKRHRLATLLGFPSWAEYITADKMVGSAKNASDFIDRIAEAAKPVAAREYATLLARKQLDTPGAARVNAWEASYYSELVRKSNYSFDTQKVRPYFPYARVKQGVLDVTSKLFGVTFKPAPGAPVWHPSVEAFEMFDGGKLAGRFYLDMHPRPNKYTHAAHFGIRVGRAGTQIPEAALVCNFPGGEKGDTGLMEPDDVETFFHEFGHLLHNLFAGRHQWLGIGGIRTERDFAEAPSQMLEEWVRDPAVLATFAKHHETDEAIPPSVVQQMNRAREFAKALQVQRQMVYARTSLSFYDRDPAQVNTDRMIREFTEMYQPYAFVDGTHFQTAFGHLDGYSAVYYTYQWSLVIAKDMFSKFDQKNLLEPTIAARYREKVLAPGGSAPAAKLVENFLGRPYGFDSYEAWLKSERQ